MIAQDPLIKPVALDKDRWRAGLETAGLGAIAAVVCWLGVGKTGPKFYYELGAGLILVFALTRGYYSVRVYVMTMARQLRTALESLTQLRALLEHMPVGVCLVDQVTGRFLEVNDALVRYTGLSRAQLLRETCWGLIQPHWHEFESRQVGGAHEGREWPVHEIEYQRKDGGSVPVSVCVTPARESGRQLSWGVVQDISERKAMESRLLDAARRDRLTGLANRQRFMEMLQTAVERVRVGTQQCYAVLFLDFDRFKLVNDVMGHAAGDRLLCEIARNLQQHLRVIEPRFAAPDTCLVARFGGDEFLVLMNDVAEKEAQGIAEQLLERLSHRYIIQGREVHSTASMGIVASSRADERAEALVRNADVAMYEAKRRGRGCAVLFNEAMRTQLTRLVMVEDCLRKALGTAQLSLVYQPIVELDAGHTTSVEALCRWQQPQLGMVYPSEFIPVAEESGLIVDLGRWVLREACHQLAQWRQLDPQRAPRTISVNISRAELSLGDRLLKEVRSVLEDTRLPAECLQLEVTEREVMLDPEGTLALMRQLRALGVRFAMDDFGTGTSSLACLRDYPFDVVKIDRSFVDGMTTNADVLAMIHATVTLVEHLGRASVAEGVEQPEQVAVLQSLGCHFAQGYHFGRPMTAHQLQDRLFTVAARKG